jgi:nitroreductase
MSNVNTKVRKAGTSRPRPDLELPQEAETAVAVNPDFASVVLTIDHMATQEHAPGHTIRKWVTSTQSLAESMLALIGYYGEQHLLARETTLELFAQAQACEHAVFVYHTPQNVQIVASIETFALMAERFGLGSLFVATEKLEQIVAQQVGAQIAASGGVVPLSLFALSTEDPDIG